MKNIYFSIVILFLLVTPVIGQEIKSYTVEYDIYSNNVLVDLHILLNNRENNFQISIPKDSEAIEVKNLKFETQNIGNKKILTIKNSSFNEINLKYITSSFIEKSSDDTFFILDLSNLSSNKKDITVKLPEKAVLKYNLESLEQSVIPKTDKVFTDGKRIIIKWDETDLKYAGSLLIIYNQENNNNLIWFALTFILIIVFIFVFNKFFKNKFLKKDKELTRNLFDEEKKIVAILIKAKNNELWQKQLELESGISKVRLSRRLRNLEQKGLIEKILYGNTNKIRLKR